MGKDVATHINEDDVTKRYPICYRMALKSIFVCLFTFINLTVAIIDSLSLMNSHNPVYVPL